MHLYRFSPIRSKEALMEAIYHTHFESYKMCKQSFGEYFPNRGNIGIFCHYDDEYEYLTKLRKEMTESSVNFNQKYFKLRKPIVIPARDEVPETTYEFLYIRRPDPYRHHVGDLDFYLEDDEYAELKKSMLDGRKIKGARVFDRPELCIAVNPQIVCQIQEGVDDKSSRKPKLQQAHCRDIQRGKKCDGQEKIFGRGFCCVRRFHEKKK